MEDEKTERVIYFIFRNGRKIMVREEEWEASWLRWWENSQRKAAEIIY